MSGMDDAVRLGPDDREFVVGLLAAATSGDVLVAVDDIDRALKVKVAGRWSPPIGRMDAPPRDAARTAADDLTVEARTLARESTVHPLSCNRPCCLDPADLR